MNLPGLSRTNSMAHQPINLESPTKTRKSQVKPLPVSLEIIWDKQFLANNNLKSLKDQITNGVGSLSEEINKFEDVLFHDKDEAK